MIDFISAENGRSLEETKSFYKEAGGAPANVAAAISKLGGASYFAGCVGNDPFGYYLKHTLQSFGVKTDYLVINKTISTTLAFVSLMKDGERDFVFLRGADSEYSTEKEILDKIEDLKIIHFGSATALLGGKLEQTYNSIIDYAVEKKLFISFDPNYRNAFWKGKEKEFVYKNMEYLKKADLIKLSEEELKIFSGKSSVEEGVRYLYELHPATYCITLGKNGTFVFNEKYSQVIKSISVFPVDTTGAGDAFTGALLYKLSKTANPYEIVNDDDFLYFVKFANITGAIVTTGFGALVTLPTREEVEFSVTTAEIGV